MTYLLLLLYVQRTTYSLSPSPTPKGRQRRHSQLLQKLGETLTLRTADNEFFQLLRKVLNPSLHGSLLSTSTRCSDGPCDGGPNGRERRACTEVEGALGFSFSLPSLKSKNPGGIAPRGRELLGERTRVSFLGRTFAKLQTCGHQVTACKRVILGGS